MDIVKVCKVHGELTARECAITYLSRKYFQCRKCKYEVVEKWRKNNKEKIKIIRKNYRDNNKEKVKVRELKYRTDNKEKCRYSHTRWREKNINSVKIRESNAWFSNKININDKYIKALISDNGKAYIPHKLIPNELIELKRTVILIRREIKRIRYG